MRANGSALGWKAAFALLALTVVIDPASAVAQVGNDSATVDSRAAILSPGTIIRLTDMDFGKIAVPSAPGTVVLTPAASPTCNTSGGLIHTGNCRAASFAGDLTLLFTLRITRPPAGQFDLTGPGGATMRVNNLTFGGTSGLLSLGSTATEQRYLVLSLDGKLTFHLGGTLRVAANQAPGKYTGSFVLQFNYD